MNSHFFTAPFLCDFIFKIQKKEERRCVIWNEKYLISYIEKEDENYYFLNYKKAEKEG